MAERAAKQAYDQSGRALGSRALRTRARLLEATENQLEQRSVRELSVVDITRAAGTSPATFYQYFKDVTEAVLHLAEAVSAQIGDALSDIDDQWIGEPGLENARKIVDVLMRYWDDRRSLLLARNVLADEGDRRFHDARRRSVVGLIFQLRKRLSEVQRQGRIESEMNTMIAAIGLVAMIERLAAYNVDLANAGVPRGELAESCARILHDAMART